jgi:hypothetical protein
LFFWREQVLEFLLQGHHQCARDFVWPSWHTVRIWRFPFSGLIVCDVMCKCLLDCVFIILVRSVFRQTILGLHRWFCSEQQTTVKCGLDRICKRRKKKSCTVINVCDSYVDGKVCLSILGTWSGPGWAPVQTLMSVLLSILSLLSAAPYHNEPGYY